MSMDRFCKTSLSFLVVCFNFISLNCNAVAHGLARHSLSFCSSESQDLLFLNCLVDFVSHDISLTLFCGYKKKLSFMSAFQYLIPYISKTILPRDYIPETSFWLVILITCTFINYLFPIII